MDASADTNATTVEATPTPTEPGVVAGASGTEPATNAPALLTTTTTTSKKPKTTKPPAPAKCDLCQSDDAGRGRTRVVTCGTCSSRFHPSCAPVVDIKAGKCPICEDIMLALLDVAGAADATQSDVQPQQPKPNTGDTSSSSSSPLPVENITITLQSASAVSSSASPAKTPALVTSVVHPPRRGAWTAHESAELDRARQTYPPGVVDRERLIALAVKSRDLDQVRRRLKAVENKPAAAPPKPATKPASKPPPSQPSAQHLPTGSDKGIGPPACATDALLLVPANILIQGATNTPAENPSPAAMETALARLTSERERLPHDVGVMMGVGVARALLGLSPMFDVQYALRVSTAESVLVRLCAPTSLTADAVATGMLTELTTWTEAGLLETCEGAAENADGVAYIAERLVLDAACVAAHLPSTATAVAKFLALADARAASGVGDRHALARMCLYGVVALAGAPPPPPPPPSPSTAS